MERRSPKARAPFERSARPSFDPFEWTCDGGFHHTNARGSLGDAMTTRARWRRRASTLATVAAIGLGWSYLASERARAWRARLRAVLNDFGFESAPDAREGTLATNAGGMTDDDSRENESSADDKLSREMARVNGITKTVAAPGRMAALRRGLNEALGRESETPEEKLGKACVALAAASAMELLTRTTVNLIARRGFLDRESGVTRETLDDTSRAAFLQATSVHFFASGVRELTSIARAIVERELEDFGRESWTREDAIDFMRRCRETMSRALLVPSDVFSDPKALPFERKNRLHVMAPRAFPSWESMLLTPKNPDFNEILGPAPKDDADGHELQVRNLRDVMNETRLVVRSPHFVVAMNDAMHAAWRAHADALPRELFGGTRSSTIDVVDAAHVVDATTERIASDATLLAAIANESGVVFFGDAIW